MISGTEITLSLIGGLTLGALYFGGLWWTIRRMPNARNPLGFYAGSLVVRTLLLLACLFVFLKWNPLCMLVALAGFFVARMAIVGPTGLTPRPSMNGNHPASTPISERTTADG